MDFKSKLGKAGPGGFGFLSDESGGLCRKSRGKRRSGKCGEQRGRVPGVWPRWHVITRSTAPLRPAPHHSPALQGCFPGPGSAFPARRHRAQRRRFPRGRGPGSLVCLVARVFRVLPEKPRPRARPSGCSGLSSRTRARRTRLPCVAGGPRRSPLVHAVVPFSRSFPAERLGSLLAGRQRTVNVRVRFWTAPSHGLNVSAVAVARARSRLLASASVPPPASFFFFGIALVLGAPAFPWGP